MRKVKAKYYDRMTSHLIEITGHFHQWAPQYEEFESGPGNYTVALIEDENGQIIECLPLNVQFLEPMK
ncbi:MAG: hypothetical protein PHW03_05375 [Eubacteriales bacterium]|nr:hypothetical protein [Eubacteriales bacterium]